MNHIPTWVIILFFVLLYLGIKRCYSRILSVKQLALIPVVFTVIGLRSAFQLFSFSISGFGMIKIIFWIMMHSDFFHNATRSSIIKNGKRNGFI